MNSNDDRGGSASTEINASPLALARGSALRIRTYQNARGGFYAAIHRGWGHGPEYIFPEDARAGFPSRADAKTEALRRLQPNVGDQPRQRA